jgi:hypothetical protein
MTTLSTLARGPSLVERDDDDHPRCTPPEPLALRPRCDVDLARSADPQRPILPWEVEGTPSALAWGGDDDAVSAQTVTP